MSAPAIRLLLRQINKHQSCGSLPVSLGSQEADRETLARAVNAALGPEARVSCSHGNRYPQSDFEFVIDAPAGHSLEQAAKDLRFALLSDPVCAQELARRGAEIAASCPDPRALARLKIPRS